MQLLSWLGLCSSVHSLIYYLRWRDFQFCHIFVTSGLSGNFAVFGSEIRACILISSLKFSDSIQLLKFLRNCEMFPSHAVRKELYHSGFVWELGFRLWICMFIACRHAYCQCVWKQFSPIITASHILFVWSLLFYILHNFTSSPTIKNPL